MDNSEQKNGCPFSAPKAKIYNGITGLNVFGKEAREDLFSIFDEKSYRLLMSRQPLLTRDIFLINNPENFRNLIVDMPERVPKSEQMRQALQPLVGDGIFLSNGETWKRRRSMVEPAIKSLTPNRTFYHINGAVKDMLQRFEKSMSSIESETGQINHTKNSVLDLEAELSHVTADAVFRAIFSEKLDSDVAKDLFRSLQSYQASLPLLSLKTILGLPNWLPGGVSKEGKKHAQRIRDIIAELIDRRTGASNQEQFDDILTQLIASTDQHGKGLTRVELIDEIAVLFLAGHETSASSLTWTIYLTKNDERAFKLLNQELEKNLAGREITRESLNQLEVAKNLFSEGLRLYPPVPFTTRDLSKNTPMRSWNMRKGSMVVVSPWLVQRHQRFWQNPDDFIADRFAKKNRSQIDRRAYMPFGTGPRVCPGAAFALMEGPLILASLFQRFEFEIESDKSLRPVCRLTTRPSCPIYIRILSKK